MIYLERRKRRRQRYQQAGQQITFWVSLDEKTQLLRIAQERHCSVSDLVREAVKVCHPELSHNSQS